MIGSSYHFVYYSMYHVYFIIYFFLRIYQGTRECFRSWVSLYDWIEFDVEIIVFNLKKKKNLI